MAEKGTMFDLQSAERIGDVVREVEGAPLGGPRYRRHRFGASRNNSTYHFKIVRIDDTHVRVLGGSRIRDAVGSQNVVPLTGDLGDSPTYDLYKTLTITESVYVWVELDNWYAPGALTAEMAAAYPVADDTDRQFVLGHVAFSGGKITVIEPYWTGGDHRDQFQVLDGDSLGYALADNETQITDWNIASSGGSMPTASLVPYHNDINNDLLYANQADFGNWIKEYFDGGGGIWPYENWVDLLDTTGTLNAGSEGYLGVVTDQGGGHYHLELTDPDSIGEWWKLDGDFTESYGPEIGNSTGAQKVIDLDLEQLFIGGGNPSLDWGAQQLINGSWSVPSTTPYIGNDTGAFQVAGGINFQEQSGGTDATRTVELLADGSGLTGYTGAIVGTSTNVDCILAAGDGWGLYGRGNAYEGYVGSISAGAAGYFNDAATSVTELCNDEYGVDVTTGAINAEAGYYFDDTAGVGINDWVAGGIMIGPNIVNKLIGQCDPNDRIMVIEA